MNYAELQTCKVWGCPAYVLDPRIQDGKKLPKWQPKSRRGQFLGRSRRHASNIGLIRNLRTGSKTTQFHVVYDNHFTTIPSEGRLNDNSLTSSDKVSSNKIKSRIATTQQEIVSSCVKNTSRSTSTSSGDNCFILSFPFDARTILTLRNPW